MNASLNYLIGRIAAELARLDLDHETFGSSCPVVDAPDDLPEGWAAIREEGYCYAGPAATILEALAGAEYGGQDPEDPDHTGLQAAWSALDAGGIEDYTRHPEPDAIGLAWNDYHEFAGLDLPGGLGLIAIRTNGGLLYGFAPTDPDYSAFNATHDFSDWHETVGGAIAAAESQVIEEAAREASE